MNVVAQIEWPHQPIAHVVLIVGLDDDKKNYKIKNSAKDGATLIPVNRLTSLQHTTLSQNDRYFKENNGGGFNLTRRDLDKRLRAAHEEATGSKDISLAAFGNPPMFSDRGYALRFNKNCRCDEPDEGCKKERWSNGEIRRWL